MAPAAEAADLYTPSDPARVPTLLHAALFFSIAVVLMFGTQFAAVAAAHALHLLGPGTLASSIQLALGDARYGIPVQAFSYLLLLAGTAATFRFVWGLPFAVGLHWNSATALRRFLPLVGAGLACGLANSVAGAFLPMPKDAPILDDLLRSPLGAWFMLVFGITLAPLLEEIAFRGFLLPGFANAFASLARHRILSPAVYRSLGLPLSVLLTSLPFALIHGMQVGHAWAPLLLIGAISVALCVVRLLLDSVAASTLVHASYNLTLFAGLLWQTDGFRHLSR